jgi:hypothetical protein
MAAVVPVRHGRSVARNQLSGSVPQGILRQLQRWGSLQRLELAGNAGLCGRLPLLGLGVEVQGEHAAGAVGGSGAGQRAATAGRTRWSVSGGERPCLPRDVHVMCQGGGNIHCVGVCQTAMFTVASLAVAAPASGIQPDATGGHDSWHRPAPCSEHTSASP